MGYPTNNESGKLTVQTAPTVLPASVAECKTALRVDQTAHDTLIENLIKAARDFVETTCRITLTNTTYDYRLDRFPLGNIELRRPPVSSVTSVSYIDINGDSQTLTANDDYHVDIYGEPPQIEPNDSWPSTLAGQPNEVTIRYVAGFGAVAANVPERIRQALIAIVIDMYEHPGLQTELVNGLHPNKTIDRLLASFKRFVIV